MPTYRLVRTDGMGPASQRLRQFRADSNRDALVKARGLIRGGTGELWRDDELVCKIGL